MSKPEDKTFYTSAFTKNIFARSAKSRPVRSCDAQNNFVIQTLAPETKPDQIVALTGNQPFLGSWNPQKALRLSDDNHPLWEIRLNVAEISFPLEYKFVVLDSDTNQLCYWEEGENRILHHPPQPDHEHFSIPNPPPLRTPELSWKACGTVVPIFSLRSEHSWGIGDLGDLKQLIEWAIITKQHVIQVLPMNDTTLTHTWKDSYPYSAISIYALHPLYINIPMMGELKDKKKKGFYQKIQQQLNENESVDYPSVEKYKTAYYHDYFEQEKDNILTDKDFQQFISQNKEWLTLYAAFSYLRDWHQTADFTKWGEDAIYNPEKMENLYHTDSEVHHAFSYLFFIQFMLHTQFEAISRYARKNHVILKGDLPIGVNRESVETWTEPDYFNRQAQAGAPPDNFSEKGQNWSFPTYNWEVMQQDNYRWWKKRLQHLQQYFDCIRIDHILGFFRIWEIPIDYTEGLCGYFNPALPLTKTEIEQYGMTFDERWLTPRIHIKYIPSLVGAFPSLVGAFPSLVGAFPSLRGGTTKQSNEVINKYLHHDDSEHLVLNANCSTQRKIEQLFNGRNDDNSQIIRDGLMSITNEVLFIQDNPERHLYHPRISAFQSYVYLELSEQNRCAFDRLYHDFFFKRHNDFWKKTAISRLQPLLKSTEMLICGEDLGMIPATVQEVMQSLQIFSLELERMPKSMDTEFTDLTNLPYHSVCTTSTHDMNPIRAWWTENREKTQRYYNYPLCQDGKAPEKCPPVIAKQIIYNHLRASSMLTMIPLQDWFAMDEHLRRPDAEAERINDPANPNHYWRYRMHITIETLLQSSSFNENIRSMITESGR